MDIDKRTRQYMLQDAKRFKLARTVLCVPDGTKWNKEALTKIGSTPYGLHKTRARGDVQPVWDDARLSQLRLSYGMRAGQKFETALRPMQATHNGEPQQDP